VNDKDKLRIGDSDRELVSRLLKSAVDEGRLTLAEYDERLQQVFVAKTVGDLDPITGDLMGAGRGVLAVTERGGLESASPRGHSRGRRTRGTPAWVKWMWFGWTVPVVVTSVIWLIAFLTGNPDPFWPAWVAGPAGAVLLCVTGMERFMIRPMLESGDEGRV
jgi:hypothetical protein